MLRGFGHREYLAGHGVCEKYVSGAARGSWMSRASELLTHARLDEIGDETFDAAAELKDLFDEPRADVGVSLRRHHEDGLDARLKSAVHERHLQLVLVIGDGADAAHDGVSLLLDGVLHQEPLEAIDRQAARARLDAAERVAQNRLPLFDREQRLLLRVDDDGDDDLVEEVAAATDDVEVTVRDGIEGAGIDGTSHKVRRRIVEAPDGSESSIETERRKRRAP